MPFGTDAKYAAEVGKIYGEYLSTFTSEHGQARADLFRVGDHLVAHVSFPTGLDAVEVTDRYVSELWAYAREHGFEERLKIILSSNS